MTDHPVRSLVDGLLEAPVAPSFTRIGLEVRSRVDRWQPNDGRLDDRIVVLTGATSGLGLAATEHLAGRGATVVLVGRDIARVRGARNRVAAHTGNETLEAEACDLGDLDAVRSLAASVMDRHGRVDVLVHNAGALDSTRRLSPQGIESTVATQVVGPFLLTALLLEPLRAAAPGRVLTMSSGGMYAAALTVSGLEMGEEDYRGSEQYARAKRAQVTLNEMWAERFDRREVVFHALHPGWADTPGVQASLPTFRRLMGPLLRTPTQGADTLVWLAGDDGEPLDSSGRFWHDRRPRPLHRLPTTARSDTAQRRARLWSWCVERADVDPVA